MEKIITVDDKQIRFKANANTVRLYRQMFGKDLLMDMQKLNVAYAKQNLDKVSLEIFENFAYVMAKQGNSEIEPIDEWFDQFETFSIYEILPQLIDLWNISTDSSNVKLKKNNDQVSAE